MSRHPEGCESGRIGTIGNRVSFTGPWVQIPPSPLGTSLVSGVDGRLLTSGQPAGIRGGFQPGIPGLLPAGIRDCFQPAQM